uniref:hypothetical protein n=1 Tax=Amycolatopsis sp. CA-151526 TaxID=3239921 RepID=UPI003F499337
MAAAVAESAVARLVALPGISTAGELAAESPQSRLTRPVLPVAPALAGLLPDVGLRRGSTVAVQDSTSLLLALVAEVTAAKLWVAVVGVPNLGVVAAAEHGVDPERLALVPAPGREQYPAVMGALLDGVDVVVTTSRDVAPALARRLSSRARKRGSVLLSVGSWPAPADLVLRCEFGAWCGLDGEGRGYLQSRTAQIHLHGRGAAARPRTAAVQLPAASGCVAAGLEPDLRDATRDRMTS